GASLRPGPPLAPRPGRAGRDRAAGRGFGGALHPPPSSSAPHGRGWARSAAGAPRSGPAPPTTPPEEAAALGFCRIPDSVTCLRSLALSSRFALPAPRHRTTPRPHSGVLHGNTDHSVSWED